MAPKEAAPVIEVVKTLPLTGTEGQTVCFDDLNYRWDGWRWDPQLPIISSFSETGLAPEDVVAALRSEDRVPRG